MRKDDHDVRTALYVASEANHVGVANYLTMSQAKEKGIWDIIKATFVIILKATFVIILKLILI